MIRQQPSRRRRRLGSPGHNEAKNGNKAKKMDGRKNFRVRNNYTWKPEHGVYTIRNKTVVANYLKVPRLSKAEAEKEFATQRPSDLK